MARSFVFAKNKLSNYLKGYLISRALVQAVKYGGIEGKFLKIGISIGMLFLLEEKIGIGMLSTLQNRYG